MKLLILIIANDDIPLYIKLQDTWRERLKKDINIDYYFIKANPSLSQDIEISNDTIFVKCEENLNPGILIKTIKSIQYCYTEYDFVLRTNLSSFYIPEKLYSYLLDKPHEQFYHACIGTHNGIRFGSGCGFILSKDVCELLTTIDINSPQHYLDDVYIAQFLANNGIKCTPCKRVDIVQNGEQREIQNTIKSIVEDNDLFHVRIKINDRNKEPFIHRILNNTFIKHKKVAITFASENMKNTLSRFKQELVNSKSFDEVYAFTESDFEDDFNPHLDFVKNNKRGFGYWLWKPYFIKKMLDKLDYGDTLVYADAGCTLSSSPNELINKCIMSEYGIFANPNCIIKDYTKMDTFEACGVSFNDYKDKWMVEAGRQIIHKREHTVNLINKWWDICIKDNYHYIDDTPSIKQNDVRFQDHRHDQSIYTLLFHKLGGHPVNYSGIIDATRLRY